MAGLGTPRGKRLGARFDQLVPVVRGPDPPVVEKPDRPLGLDQPVEVSALVDNSLVAQFNDFDRDAVRAQAEAYQP